MSDYFTLCCLILALGALAIIYRVVRVVGDVLTSGSEERSRERQDYIVLVNHLMDRFSINQDQAIDLADLHRLERTNDRGIDASLSEAQAKVKQGVSMKSQERKPDPRFTTGDPVSAEIRAVGR